MKPEEFAIVIAYLEFGCGQKLPTERAHIFYDLLKDFDYNVFQIAAKRVILEHPWATFPSAAELRQAAVLTMQGEIKALSAGEAWALAWKAVANCDPEIDLRGGVKDTLSKLPPLVAEAVKSMGMLALCYGQEPVAVIRGQFMKVYGELASRQARTDLLPAATREAIAGAKPKVAKLLAGIGTSVEDKP